MLGPNGRLVSTDTALSSGHVRRDTRGHLSLQRLGRNNPDEVSLMRILLQSHVGLESVQVSAAATPVDIVRTSVHSCSCVRSVNRGCAMEGI
jgi:hypothetical protein